MVIQEVVVSEEAGHRFDRFVWEAFETVPTRAAARKAIRRGEFTLDGERVESGRFVRSGQRVQRHEPESPWTPLEVDLACAFEDDCLAVVVKPPGFWTNGARARTVERALPFNLRPSDRVDALRRPRPVHRLDAPTGGLLLCAKTSRAMVELGRAFQARVVRKRYRALVVGRMDGEGVVDTPIEGRVARTRWNTVAVTRALHGEWISTVDLWPTTGRTHQLRRHMAGLGHPILGDVIYGIDGLILRGKGLFLWSLEVGFPHPEEGRPVTVAIEEPAKFQGMRAREERRWTKWRG